MKRGVYADDDAVLFKCCKVRQNGGKAWTCCKNYKWQRGGVAVFFYTVKFCKVVEIATAVVQPEMGEFFKRVCVDFFLLFMPGKYFAKLGVVRSVVCSMRKKRKKFA